MSASDRIKKLEQRSPRQRPHGMTAEQLALHLSGMDARQLEAFAKTMTDADLSASIDFLKELTHDNA